MQAEIGKVRRRNARLTKRIDQEVEKGLEGVELPLKSLRDYYSKDDQATEYAAGAGAECLGALGLQLGATGVYRGSPAAVEQAWKDVGPGAACVYSGSLGVDGS